MKKKRKKKPWTIPQRYKDYLKRIGYEKDIKNITDEAKRCLKENSTLPIIDADFHRMYWDDLSIALTPKPSDSDIGGWPVLMRPNKKIIYVCEEIMAPAIIVKKETRTIEGFITHIWAAHIESEDDIIHAF